MVHPLPAPHEAPRPARGRPPPEPENDAVIGPKEEDRKKAWEAGPANVRHEIEKSHIDMGHLATTSMIRMLRRAGAKPEVLRLVALFLCQVCQDTMNGKHPRPTRYEGNFTLSVTISVDCCTIHDASGIP